MSNSEIQLIVGLGNPGAEYAATRHNAGVWLLEKFAQQHGTALRTEAKFFSLYAKAGGYHLLFPQTYMNASGRAVAAACQFYKIPPEAVLVIHDELDLAPGVARFKQGGGNGGQNGLKDIQAALDSAAFWRLRLGIGHPGDRKLVVQWVLKPPRQEEQTLIDIAIGQALDVLPQALKGQMNQAMQQLHRQN